MFSTIENHKSKISRLPLKLGIFVVLVFSAVITTCLLWTPVRVRWYLGKLNSTDAKERVKGVDGLIAMGERGRDTLAKELAGGEAAAGFLITHWPKPNDAVAQDKHGCCPLHLAAVEGYPTVAELFIAKGAKVNAKDSDGWTPLHWAENKDIVVLLIEKGAEVNAKDYYYNVTPLDVTDDKEIESLLRAHGGERGRGEIKDTATRRPGDPATKTK